MDDTASSDVVPPPDTRTVESSTMDAQALPQGGPIDTEPNNLNKEPSGNEQLGREQEREKDHDRETPGEETMGEPTGDRDQVLSKRRFIIILLVLSLAILLVLSFMLTQYRVELQYVLGMKVPKDPFGGTLDVDNTSSSSVLFKQRHWLPTRILITASKFVIPLLLVVLVAVGTAFLAIRMSNRSNYILDDGDDASGGGLLDPPRMRTPRSDREKQMMETNLGTERVLLIVGAVGLAVLAVFLLALWRYVQARQQPLPRLPSFGTIIYGTHHHADPPAVPSDGKLKTMPSIETLYELTKRLGSGGFGEVWLAKPKYHLEGVAVQPKQVAVKRILSTKREALIEKRRKRKERKRDRLLKEKAVKPDAPADGSKEEDGKVPADGSRDSKQLPEEDTDSPKIVPADDIDRSKMLLRREAKVLKRLDHENIIKFYDYLPRDGHAMYQDEEALVTEYVDRSLDDLDLSSVLTIKSRSTWLSVARQLFSVLTYLHDRAHMKHLDLKPGNIMYTTSSSPPSASPLTIKLIDFGMCVRKEKAVEYCGTYIFMAPELVKRGGQSVDEKADIWSAGITLLALYHSNHGMIWKIDQKRYQEDCQERLKQAKEAFDRKVAEAAAKKKAAEEAKQKKETDDKADKKEIHDKTELLKFDEKEVMDKIKKEVKKKMTHAAILAMDPDKPETWPVFPESMPKEFQALVMRCLQPDPSKRPSASVLLQDPLVGSWHSTGRNSTDKGFLWKIYSWIFSSG